MLAVQTPASLPAHPLPPPPPPSQEQQDTAQLRADQVPENAPEACPGLDSEQAGKASACAGCANQTACASAPKGPDPDIPIISKRLRNVRRTVLVMSGKGGVGKSTFTAQLAWTLSESPRPVWPPQPAKAGAHLALAPPSARADATDGEANGDRSDDDDDDVDDEYEVCQTAVMDIDICGPSIPTVLGLTSSQVHASASGWSPVYVSDSLCAMSVGFLLPSQTTAVIWRGTKKNALIKQFLKDVDWTGAGADDDGDAKSHADGADQTGDATAAIDYMLVDTPPGTTDEHLSIVSYLRQASDGFAGAVLVTTPQEVALQDVRKQVSFCRKTNVPILGVVENMAGFVCPACHGRSDVFYPSTGGAKALCEELGLTFLGSVPLDPRIGKCCDLGESFVHTFPDSPASVAYNDIIDHIKVLVP